MIYVHADIAQIARDNWRAYINEYDFHVSAGSEKELLHEIEWQLEREYLGAGQYTLIATRC